MVNTANNYNFSMRDLETHPEFDNRIGICVTGSVKIGGCGGFSFSASAIDLPEEVDG